LSGVVDDGSGCETQISQSYPDETGWRRLVDASFRYLHFGIYKEF
jgi:hypothetical protein